MKDTRQAKRWVTCITCPEVLRSTKAVQCRNCQARHRARLSGVKPRRKRMPNFKMMIPSIPKS